MQRARAADRAEAVQIPARLSRHCSVDPARLSGSAVWRTASTRPFTTVGFFLCVGCNRLIGWDAVDGGHRAVKYSRWSGVLPQVFEEGTHLMIPWLETPIIYDVRAKPRNITSLSGTKGTFVASCRVFFVETRRQICKW